MNTLRLSVLLLLLSSAPAAATPTHEKPLPKKASANKKTQAGFAAVVVNGRTLTGPNSTAQTVGNRIVVPVSSIARVFGDSTSVNPAARSVTVVRQSGITAVFDARIGQVAENGAVILSVSNSGEIAFPPNADELMLPIEIAATLLDVSIRYDQAHNVVLVIRGQPVSGVNESDRGRGLAELYQANYEFNLSRYSSSLAQNLTLTATGRLADGRFYLTSNSSGSTFGQFTPRNFSFNLERPNGQRFIAGDFGSGAALQLLTANVRGGLASIPFGEFTLAAFGGRTDSGTVMTVLAGVDDIVFPVRRRPRFDTNVLGFYASRAIGDRSRQFTLAAGAMRFGGVSRSGTLASSSLSYAGSRLRLQADVGIGTFYGRTNDDRRVSGTAAAVDLAATYQLAENLSVQGRYARIGANFLSPQSGVREPVDLKAAGVTWSPAKWLTASLNASTARRPYETGRADRFITAAFGVTPRAGKPRFYLSHTQNSSKLIRSGAFTLLNASKDFTHWRLFLNATRIKAMGAASVNAQFGANISINDRNSLEISQGVGSHRNFNGLIDWRTSGLFAKRLSLTAGAGYSYSPTAKIAAFERVTASMVLPRQSSLQVSYMHTISGPTLLVQLRGTLFRKKDAASYLNAGLAEANNFGRVSGRVYQDVDGNGQYEAGVDKAQASVKVRVDGNRYVETDANGVFAFEAMPAGGHKVYLDLLSVRADLTLLDGGSRDIALDGGKNASMDFRLVRTGRITGRVWLDTNANGKFDEGESPLADIRVLTGSGRDTLTDADGYFTIADLAPGEHVVLIDEKTLPEKTTIGFKPLAVQVFAGRETGDIVLPVIERPAEVKRFGKQN